MSAVLFYKKLAVFKRHGFEINQYGPCDANKIVGGQQLTVMWHVDDLKLSNINSKTVDYSSSRLKAHMKQS